MRIYRELSPTTRAKISKKMKGRLKTDKHKAAYSSWNAPLLEPNPLCEK